MNYPKFGTIQSKTKSFGAGFVLQFFALLGMIWAMLSFDHQIWAPAVLIGVVLIIVGWNASRIHLCSECGNRVQSKAIKFCPTCGATFAIKPMPEK